MSSERERFESLQREFNRYYDDFIAKQAPKVREKKKAKQEVAVAPPPVVAVESTAKKRGRKPKVEGAPVVC